MPSRAAAFLLAAVACFSTAPLAAQETQAASPQTAAQVKEAPRSTAGPRLQPEYQSYEPSLARDRAETSTAAAAAADRTIITISTLGLVLLIILLVILIA